MNGLVLVFQLWFIFSFDRINGLRCYYGYGNSVLSQTDCPKTANNYCAVSCLEYQNLKTIRDL